MEKLGELIKDSESFFENEFTHIKSVLVLEVESGFCTFYVRVGKSENVSISEKRNYWK